VSNKRYMSYRDLPKEVRDRVAERLTVPERAKRKRKARRT